MYTAVTAQYAMARTDHPMWARRLAYGTKRIAFRSVLTVVFAVQLKKGVESISKNSCVLQNVVPFVKRAIAVSNMSTR